MKLCRQGDSRKIEFLRRLGYGRQLGNSCSMIIPIDLEANLFGISPRDFRYGAKDRAYFSVDSQRFDQDLPETYQVGN